MRRGSRQRGAAGLALLGVGMLLLLLAALVVDVGRALATRAQAAAAADAAALAAAPVTFRPFGARGSPTEEASRFAAANGAKLVSCTCPLDPSWERREVEVLVEATTELFVLGSVRLRAASRAEFVPTSLPREAASPPTTGPEPPR